MEFVKTQRGGLKLCYNGYLYVKNKELPSGNTFYECERRRRNNCKAKITLRGDQIIRETHEHTHAPDIIRQDLLSLREEMKEQAIKTQQSSQQILCQMLQNVSEGVSSQLPSMSTIRRSIRRYKQAVHAPHPIPRNLCEMAIPDEYKRTCNEDNFLLYDSGPGENRILLFSTEKNMQLLQSSSEWFCDGTFKVVPELFYQLYSIHCLVSKRTMPCVFALLPNKRQSTYEELFNQLRAVNARLNPSAIMIDYEKAAMNAISNVFPNANIKGCFFHLSQAIYRKVQTEGLQSRYQSDAEFAISIRMIPALAFVPSDSVVQAFEHLQESMCEEADGVINYFEDTFIGRRRRRNRGNPLFPICMWNMHDRVCDDLPRTINSLEGWHNHLQANITSSHPNIWRFLQVLKTEQALNDTIINQMLAGQEPPSKRKKYQDATKRIANIVQDYENREIVDFLRGIAHNLKF